jgi:hypothetical protein
MGAFDRAAQSYFDPPDPREPDLLVPTVFTLRLQIGAPVAIPQDVVQAILDHSTAIEAIEEGLWNWLPLPPDEWPDDEPVLDMSLTIEDAP